MVEAQHRYLEAQDRGDQEGAEGGEYDPFRPNPSYDMPPSESESDTESSQESECEQEGNTGTLQQTVAASDPAVSNPCTAIHTTEVDSCDELQGNLTKPEASCDKSEQSGKSASLIADLTEKCSVDAVSETNEKHQSEIE